MRKLAFGLAVLGVVVSGCGDDKKPVQANIIWRTTCDVAGGCVGSPVHEIAHIDGEKRHNVTCDLEDVGSSYSLTFIAQHTDNEGIVEYGISMLNLTFNEGGTVAAGVVTVHEGGNEFQGKASSSAPTETAPCQVMNVEIDGDDVSGTMYCEGIESLANADKIEVRAGMGSGPLDFELKNCR